MAAKLDDDLLKITACRGVLGNAAAVTEKSVLGAEPEAIKLACLRD